MRRHATTGPHQPHPNPHHSGPYPHSPQHQPPLPGQPPAAGPKPGPQPGAQPGAAGSIPPTHARLGGQVLPVPQLQILRFASKTAIFTYGFLAVAALGFLFGFSLMEEDDPLEATFLMASGGFSCAAMIAKLSGEVATHIQALIAQQRHLAGQDQGQPQENQ